MKIKVVKNSPVNDYCVDISDLVGREFEAKPVMPYGRGHVSIFVDTEWQGSTHSCLMLFRDEYEIVEE